MFVSFFPKPRLFFITAALWTILSIVVWYTFGEDLGTDLGFVQENPDEQIIGMQVFWSLPFVWFYIYYAAVVLIFGIAWQIAARHPWTRWSVFGSALIIFATYYQVQVSVAINAWYGPFYDLIQTALAGEEQVTLSEFFSQLLTFAGIAFMAVFIGVMTSFFVSHYIFRWRTAMNDYYMAHWQQLRTIEGASQRVQDDTMRFSSIMESLGVSFVGSVMTLIAFVPVLSQLSAAVTEIPIIGEIPNALVIAAIVWSLFGTGFVALIGIRLPALEFRNQRVEASYRKELVYGEDNPDRAQPPTVAELFSNVRRNYFRLYINFVYFNIGRIIYLQTDNIFPYIILAPTIVAGRITLGVLNQILNAFDQVRVSFQYLFNAWGTIVVLLSVYKRLRAFEAAIHGEPLPAIEATATGERTAV